MQPPAAEEVLIFKSIQSIESYNLRPLSIITSVSLLLPPSLITDTEPASDGSCLLTLQYHNQLPECHIVNNAKTILTSFSYSIT